MKSAESMLHYLLGPTRSTILPIALAVEYTKHLLFIENRKMDDISVMKDIYPIVAAQTNKTVSNAARMVERQANVCWERMDAEAKRCIIGKPLYDKPTPAEMLFYLAYYLHFEKPYYQVMLTSSEIFSLML